MIRLELRAEMRGIDAETRRAEFFAVGDDPLDPLANPSRDVERIARELAALLRVGVADVDVRASVRGDGQHPTRHWEGLPLAWAKTITIRVPARHWEALLTELDAVAAMLPDSAAGATVVIEDDTPPTIYDAISIGTWSNYADGPPLTRETLRAARAELDAILAPRGRTASGLPVFGLGPSPIAPVETPQQAAGRVIDGLIGSAIQWQPGAVPQTTLDLRIADDPWERDGVVLGLSEGLHPRAVATIQAALGTAMRRRVRVISIAEGIDQELW